MAKRPFQTLRRRFAPLVGVLMLASSIAGPVLDGSDRAHGPVLESEHSASSCVVAHDHTVCTQVSSNRVLAGGVARHGGLGSHTVELHLPEAACPICLDTPPANHSRAPPLG